MKKAFAFVFAVLLALPLIPATAAALTVPQSVVIENRDGRQLIVKTYTLPADAEPAGLVEEPFRQEGFDYSLLSITQMENLFSESKLHSKTITVETASKDLTVILQALPPSIAYADGGFTGELKLDHTSLHTEVTGYSTKSYTVTETKTIDGLDRNDPSYIPTTTVKDGRTLSLSNVEWAVQGTGLSGDSLVATQYMAVATYTAKASSKVANGYVTSAVYTGEVTAKGIDSITYTVTYLGEPVAVEEPVPEESIVEDEPASLFWLMIPVSTGVLALASLALWYCFRSNTTVFLLDADSIEYSHIGKTRLSRKDLNIDVRRMAHRSDTMLAVSIDARIARRLFGRRIFVQLHDGMRTHVITECRESSYWFYINFINEGEIVL